MLKPIKIVSSILGLLIGLVFILLFLFLVAYLMNVFGASDNGYVEFMYNIMRFLHFVK